MSSRKKSRVIETSSESDSSSNEERERQSSSSSSSSDSDESNHRSSKKRSRSSSSKSNKSSKSTKKSSSSKRRKSASRKSRMSWVATPMETTGFDALLQLASASTALDEGRATAEALPSTSSRKEKSSKSRDTSKAEKNTSEKKRKTSRKPRSERQDDNSSAPQQVVPSSVRKPATSPERHFSSAPQSAPLTAHHPMMMMQNMPQITSFGNHGQYVQSVNDLGQMTFVNPNINESMIMNQNVPFVSQGQQPQYSISLAPNGQQYALVGLNQMAQFNSNPQLMQQRHFIPTQYAPQQGLTQIHDQTIKQSNTIDSIPNQPNLTLFPTSVLGSNGGPVMTVGTLPQVQQKGPVQVDHKLCSRHVAIAYHIFHNQRSAVANSDRAAHDPTLEARRLKERTEWARRGVLTHAINQSINPLISQAHVPQPGDGVMVAAPHSNEAILQQQQQQQLALQLQLAAGNPQLLQQMLQNQLVDHQNLQRLNATNFGSVNGAVNVADLNPSSIVSQIPSGRISPNVEASSAVTSTQLVKPDPVNSTPAPANHQNNVSETPSQPISQQSENSHKPAVTTSETQQTSPDVEAPVIKSVESVNTISVQEPAA